jgi:hypothetical protein
MHVDRLLHHYEESRLMLLEQAQSLIASLLDREKRKMGKPEEMYGKMYVDAVKQTKRIKAHSDPEHFPSELFAVRAPNATDDQFKYVKANYKCTTNPIWQELMSVVGRAFIDNNWQMIWGEGSDELKTYCTENFPVYHSTEYFVKNVLPSIKLSDANGIIAIRPHGFKFIQNEQGEFILDDTQLPEPAIFYHPSEKVLVRERNVVVVIDDERSVVTVSGKPAKEGRVLFIYTPEAIYRSEQVGVKSDNKYNTYLYFAHGEDKMPCIDLGGIPQIAANGSIYWISPFRFATDLLDLALTNRNIMQVSIASVVFPFKIMMSDECDFEDSTSRCSMGKLVSLDTGDLMGKCHSCGGSGQRLPYSPLGQYLWKKPEGTTAGGQYPYKPVEFVEAPVQGLEFVREQVSLDTEKARSILHLHTSNSDVKGSQDMTATGMAIDRESQFAFIRGISDQIFGLWDWMFKRISFQRYGNYEQVPTLIYPQSFNFRTEADIWAQIKTAREAEAPAYIIQELFYSLLNNLLSSSPDALKIFETITNADKLFSVSATAVAARKASNAIEPWQLTIHDSALQIVNGLIRENPKYLDLDITERINILESKAKEVTFVAPTDNPVGRALGLNG